MIKFRLLLLYSLCFLFTLIFVILLTSKFGPDSIFALHYLRSTTSVCCTTANQCFETFRLTKVTGHFSQHSCFSSKNRIENDANLIPIFVFISGKIHSVRCNGFFSHNMKNYRTLSILDR